MKNKCVIYAPIETYSGYGANARDKVKAIIDLKKDEWDIKIISCKWGQTPMNFLDENPEWGWLKEYILLTKLSYQPDYMFWITIPSEAQPIGKWNCLITAGVETSIAPPEWIEGLNRMDLNLVSSEHSKKVFQDSTFEKRNKQTNVLEANIKLEKPIEVLFEGSDISVYQPLDKPVKNELYDTINNIPESFAYLFSGMWIAGNNIPIGEDRKNVGLLIKAFYETFKNKTKKPALILKTSHVGASYMDRDEILKKIEAIKSTVNSTNLPNVYLLHGEFTDEEINQLYNHPKVKAMVNLTKGEGYGRPLLEFTLVKKPLITTGWSGQVDFLDPKYTNLIGGQLTQIHPNAANQWLIKESQWLSPDHGQIGFFLRDVFENYKNYTDKAKRQAHKSKTEFSWDKMKDKVDELFTKYIHEFPEEIKLKLPSLKRIELPSLIKIEKNDK